VHVSAVAGMCHSNWNGVEYHLSILLWVLKTFWCFHIPDSYSL